MEGFSVRILCLLVSCSGLWVAVGGMLFLCFSCRGVGKVMGEVSVGSC